MPTNRPASQLIPRFCSATTDPDRLRRLRSPFIRAVIPQAPIEIQLRQGFAVAVYVTLDLKGGASMAKIFVVDQAFQATVKAVKVSQAFQADICVFVVDQEFQAKDDVHWFFVDQAFQATTKLFWVDQAFQADLKVYFVQQSFQAKWAKGHKLQNRL